MSPTVNHLHILIKWLLPLQPHILIELVDECLHPLVQLLLAQRWSFLSFPDEPGDRDSELILRSLNAVSDLVIIIILLFLSSSSPPLGWLWPPWVSQDFLIRCLVNGIRRPSSPSLWLWNSQRLPTFRSGFNNFPVTEPSRKRRFRQLHRIFVERVPWRFRDNKIIGCLQSVHRKLPLFLRNPSVQLHLLRSVHSKRGNPKLRGGDDGDDDTIDNEV